MALTFGSNPAALNAQVNLTQPTTRLAKSYQRLSSGLRLNSAADGPADISLADALRADARIASVAIRNVNDGLSLTAIADAALGQISSILTRMSELAEQSVNGVYTSVQRSALSLEFVALGSEITRIADTTKFNGIALLSNSSSLVIQAGLTGSADSRIPISAVLGTLSSIGLAGAGQKALSYSLLATGGDAAAQSASQFALDAVTAAISSISMRRGTLGAAESRLAYAVDNLMVARENFVAAESSIRDVDVAEEVTELVRLQVLQQAAQAVLAQANQQPQIAYNLLQGM